MQKTERLVQVLTLGVIVLTIVLLISSLTGAASPASGPFGIVNGDKLQSELPDFKKLDSLMKDKKAEYDSYRGYIYQMLQNAGKQLQEKATQDKAGKSPEEQAAIDKKLQEEIQKKSDELKNELEKKSNEIVKAINEQKKVVIEKEKKLIADVAAEQKLTMVFEQDAVLFGGTDITQGVIDKANKETKEVKK